MKTIVIDIDGTLAKVGDRLKYLQTSPKDWDSFYSACFDDEPIAPVVDLVCRLAPHYFLVFCTGRRESVREQTTKWLKKHLRPVNRTPFNALLLMRPDNDHRHDTVVKPELLQAHGVTPEEVAFILEDRNSMVAKWRELGYTCFQVADGDF
jgi:hypothetical protein